MEYESDINKASDNQELVWSQIEDELAEERKNKGWIKSLTARAKGYGGDQPYVICPEEGDTVYCCFRYSNDEIPLAVTQKEINDSKYNVFGISIGDELTSSEEKLYNKEYEKEEGIMY